METLPKRLRDYQIIGSLGQGGMGTVCKAMHMKLKRPVALKLMTLGQTDPAAIARFHREMEAVGRLDHPNIVRATDAGEDQGFHYLVMELVDGIDLSRLVEQRGPLPVADACELIRQASLGLQHAHDHGLVHRDIKPSNLMLTRDGRVQVLDLGLALLRSGAGGGELTGTGQVMGSVDYMAPEQARSTRKVDARADVYSQGCTLYKLLTGEAPFSGHTTPMEKMIGHDQEPIPPVEKKRSDVPKGLIAVLNQMLAKDPEKRQGKPAEVAKALAAFAGGNNLPKLFGKAPARQAVETDGATVPASAPSRPRRSKLVGPLLIGTIGIACLFIMWALYLAVTAETEGPPTTGVLPTSAGSDWIDLLATVRLPMDQEAGNWARSDGNLVSDNSMFARIQLSSYEPPAEYDFMIEFTVLQGQGEVFQIFAKNDIQARWAMWCFDYLHHSFVWNNALANAKNSTAQEAPALTLNQRYTSLVEVRNTEIRAYLDGTRISTWEPMWPELTNDPELPTRLDDRNRLGIGTYQTRVQFHRIAVRGHRSSPQ